MIRTRDFSKSNKDYFNKNKISLIILAVVLLVGIVCGIAFGFNGNFELKGYNEFYLSVNTNNSKTVSKYKSTATDIVNSHGGNVDSVSIVGEGTNTKLVIRYTKNLKASSQEEVNEEIAKKLEISAEDYISAHSHVKAVVSSKDYVYTAVAILLLVTIATIFAIFRYDGACAIAMLLSCGIGSLLYMSFSTILRLSVGLSYFAMLFIVNLLVVYCAISIFEHIRETSWLQSKEYGTALNTALKSTKNRVLFMAIALMFIGLAFVVIAPNGIKFVSINIMFMAVTLLAIVWYVLPFVWSVLITHVNIRRFKTKSKKIETKTETEK